MSFYFEYLATTSGKALLLVFDNNKYLFNCFEGFQRYSIESKSKLSQLTTVILPTQESVIPFIGTYLTMGDMGKKKLNIITKHADIMSYAQEFAHRPELRIQYYNNFEDEKVEIKTYDHMNFLNVTLQIKPLRGRFDPKKALQKGIPREKWKLLCNKEIVKHGNNMYMGEDFLADDTTFDKIAIIFNTSDFNDFEMLCNVSLVFCFHQSTAKQIAEKFEKQIYVLDDSRNVDYRSFYSLQYQLSQICSNFSLPQKIDVPARYLEKSCVDYLTSCDTIKYCKEFGSYRIKKGEQMQFLNGNCEPKNDDAIIFLGTGSAIPSKYRNVTSILVRHDTKYTLLDCGEDTCYNIVRYFGNDNIVKDIETIFISHSHADHHLGAVKVLKSILKYKEGINVICCETVANFIKLFIKSKINFYFTNVKRYKTQFNEHLLDLDHYFLKYDLGAKISICSVPHTKDSVGIRIDYRNFSIGYSGDCRPSYLFTKMIEKVDVLINEATFNDDLKENALKTKHTTIGEAENVAKQANVKTLILTHFSQRYPKKVNSHHLIVAFDFFTYQINAFDKTKYIQSLKKLEELVNE